MIGAYLSLTGQDLAEPLARRFAGSLALGLKDLPQWRPVSNAVLATVPATKAWQPTRTQTNGYVLFSGHIFNRQALQDDLGRAFSNDTEIYCAGYQAWGDQVDRRVIGEFSTIILHPEERKIRLACSPLQAPPLHYYRDNERIIVASTPRAIFATGEVAQQIDEQKLADSLFLNYMEGERGWFQGVSRTRPGTRMLLSSARADQTTYYDLRDCAPVRFAKDSDYVEAADALMCEATTTALEGFVKPAVSLSGGFDSQAVAAYAMKMRPGVPLYGFTSVPEAGWQGKQSKRRFNNEQPYVEALAAMYPQLVPEFVDAFGLSFDHNLKNMFLMGSVAPRNAMNLHWIHQVYARAKSMGCDVVLTGSKGNATFSFGGEGAITSLFAQGQWIKAVRETWAGRGNRSFPRALYSAAFSPFLPLPLWAAITRMVHGKEPDPFNSWCPMNREWAQEMRVAERAKDMGYDQHYRQHRSTTDWRAVVLGNAGMEGPDIMQGFSLLHGIAHRDPTAYRPLVEFCMGIPDDQFVRNGRTRRLARRMLKGKVPDMVLNENRRGLQAADWALRLFRQKPELLDEIDRLSSDPVMAKRLDLANLRSAVEALTAETPDDSELAHRLQLAVSRGLTTARFIRFVDGRNDG